MNDMPTKDNALSSEVNRVIAAAQLPALPQSAIRILELSKDPKNGPAEFAVPIESDPGLTGQVLRFVNSSYFGFSREISSVKLAITLVGIRTIKNFTLWSAVFSLMPNPKAGPFDLKCLWQDSLRRALYARSIANLLGLKESDDCFAAALLQDMAVPLLAKELPGEYIKLLERRTGGQERLSAIEREVLGWTHGLAAAEMARRWNLPEELALPIERHTDIEQVADDGSVREISVALSALLPSTVDETWSELPLLERYSAKLLPASAPSIPEVLAQVDTGFLEFAPVLDMSAPAKSLVECYQETAAIPG